MLTGLIRIVVGLVAIGLLIYFGWLDPKVLASAAGRPELLAVAALLILATMPLAALRWWLLLRGLEFPMGFAWSLRTTFTSQFFNIFLPGAYGGDLVRATLAYRAAGRRLARLTFSILVDRLSGLVALIFIGLGMLSGLPPAYRDLGYQLLAVAGAAIFAGAFVGLVWNEPIARLLQRVPGKLGAALAHAVREVAAALSAYVDRWPTLLAAVLISIVQFLLVLAALAIVGIAMKFDKLTLSGYALAGVWSLIVNAVPLTPGGIGAGEAAFGQIARVIEVAPSGASYATAFLALRMLVALVSVLGAFAYVSQRRELESANVAVGGDSKPS